MRDRTVSVGDLKARLSEYVRYARAGETFVVTRRGTPVARLGPTDGALAGTGRAAALAAAPRPHDRSGRSLESVLLEGLGRS